MAEATASETTQTTAAPVAVDEKTQGTARSIALIWHGLAGLDSRLVGVIAILVSGFLSGGGATALHEWNDATGTREIVREEAAEVAAGMFEAYAAEHTAQEEDVHAEMIRKIDTLRTEDREARRAEMTDMISQITDTQREENERLYREIRKDIQIAVLTGGVRDASDAGYNVSGDLAR